MGRIRVSAERRIEAPAPDVYAVLSDYERRPTMLPPNYSDFAVTEGGKGAGTLVTYRFKAGPRERTYRMRAEEREAGRVLVERDEDSSFVMTWTVNPSGEGAEVRLESAWDGASGIGGIFERLFAPKALRRVHGETLEGLAKAVRS